MALVVINVADLVFAVDSVPAIFAITTDTYIVFTANIIGPCWACAPSTLRWPHGPPLRISEVRPRRRAGLHRHQDFLEPLLRQVDPAISLSVTLAMIAGGVLLSLWKTGRWAKDRLTGAAPADAGKAPTEQVITAAGGGGTWHLTRGACPKRAAPLSKVTIPATRPAGFRRVGAPQGGAVVLGMFAASASYIATPPPRGSPCRRPMRPTRSGRRSR